MTKDHDKDTQKVSTLSPGLRLVIAIVLGALLVASAITGLVLLDKRSEVDSSLDVRRDVVRVAERFTVQVNNYDSESVDEYQESVSTMLSTKFRADFETALEEIVASVREAQMNSEGKVLASGVASLDPDSATVLVVADAEVKTVFDTRQRHFRWEVSLVKVDGEWLVDNFTPVA